MGRPCRASGIPVLAGQNQILPSARVADLAIRLPRPLINDDWPQQGGFANHAMHHLAVGDAPARGMVAQYRGGGGR